MEKKFSTEKFAIILVVFILFANKDTNKMVYNKI